MRAGIVRTVRAWFRCRFRYRIPVRARSAGIRSRMSFRDSSAVCSRDPPSREDPTVRAEWREAAREMFQYPIQVQPLEVNYINYSARERDVVAGFSPRSCARPKRLNAG